MVASLGLFPAATTVCYNSGICRLPRPEYSCDPRALRTSAASQEGARRHSHISYGVGRTGGTPGKVGFRRNCDVGRSAIRRSFKARVLNRDRAHIGAPSRARTRGRSEDPSDPELKLSPTVLFALPSRRGSDAPAGHAPETAANILKCLRSGAQVLIRGRAAAPFGAGAVCEWTS